MGILDLIREDVNMITADLDGFGVEMLFEAPSPSVAVANVVGLHTKHNMAYSPEGRPVNSRTAHITVAESALVELSYPVRNAKGEVYLKDHQVSVKDSTGTLYTYKITEFMPDETVGTITCQLSIIR